MLNINKIEQVLKSSLKGKCGLNKGVLITYLITGFIGVYGNVKTTKEENLKEDGNNFIVNIENPDENGVSHNQFEYIKLEFNENLILNNSIRSDENDSILLNRKLDQNDNFSNFSSPAKIIINEILPNNATDYINGSVEIYGNGADLIFVDEEGININGAKIYNAKDVSFKGDVLTIGENGITTFGNNERKLNFIGDSININGKISNGTVHNEDVYVIAGSGGEKEAYISVGKNAAINGRNILLKVNNIGERDSVNIEKGAILLAKNDITIDSETGKIVINVEKDSIKAENDFKLHIEKDNKIFINENKNKINVGNDLFIKIYNDSDDAIGYDIDKLDRNVKSIGTVWRDYISRDLENREYPEESRVHLINTISAKQFDVKNNVKFDYPQGNEGPNNEPIVERVKYGFNVKDQPKEDEIDRILREKEKKYEFDLEKNRFVEIQNHENLNISLDPSRSSSAKLYNYDGDNKAFILDINRVNGNGISHNYYNKLSVEAGNSLIFNNNTKYVPRYSYALNKDIKHINNNLNGTEARLILNEVDVANGELTKLAGNIEVLGDSRVDVIFVNENGINVNGLNVYNVNNLVLSTGKLKAEIENEYDFDVKKGNIIFENNESNLKNQSIVFSSKSVEFKNDLEVKGLKGNLKDNLILNNNISTKEDLRFFTDKKIINNKKLLGNFITMRGKDVENNGSLKGNQLIYINSKNELINIGDISSYNSITLRGENKIENRGSIVQTKNDVSDYSRDANIYLQSRNVINKKDIIAVGGIYSYSDKFNNENTGKLDTNKDITLDARNSLINNGSITTKDDLRIFGNNLLNTGGLYSARVEISLDGKLENINKGIISAGKTEAIIRANEIENNKATIIAFNKFDISGNNIKNVNGALIRNEGENSLSKLRAENKLENISSEIKTLGRLEIKTPLLENRGEQSSGVNGIEDKEYVRRLKIKESALKAWFNGYRLGFRIPDEKKYINVKDSNILTGNSLLIRNINENDDITVKNINGSILSGRDLKIDGNLENITNTVDKSVKELLENIKISLDWDTSSLVNSNTIFDRGNDGQNVSLYEILKNGKINLYDGKYFTVLKNANIPELDKVLNFALGNDWKSKKEIVLPEDLDNKIVKYYNLRNSALVSAKNNLFLEFGRIINSDASNYSGNKGYRDKYDADIFYEKVENLENINLENVADVLKENLIEENGLFNKSASNKYIFESSKFVQGELEGYVGFDYLNSKVEKALKKDIRLIGDNYYQFNLISNMILSLDPSNVRITKERVKDMLNNASLESRKLNLQLGKELTKEQRDKLDRDIVWYVETELNGEKLLTPVIYLSPKTLAKIRVKKDSFGQITAGGNIFTYRTEDVINRNSLISADSNTIINSETLSSRGSKVLNTEISSSNRLVINANSNIEFENADILGNSGIDLYGENVDVLSSNIISNGGNVNIEADNINISDRIEKKSNSFANSEIGLSSHSFQESTERIESSVASNIKGENVKLTADKDLSIRGSNILGKDNIDIVSENINVDASVSNNETRLYTSTSGTDKGIINLETSASYVKEEEKLNRSVLSAGNGVFLTAEKDLKLEASDIVGGKGIVLEAGNNIKIEDKLKKNNQNSYTHSLTTLSLNNSEEEIKETKSEGTNIITEGYLGISGSEINIKSSNIVANASNISAKNNINFDSSEETYKENSHRETLSINTEGSAGILGIGIRAEKDTLEDGATVETIDNYNIRNKNKNQLSTLSTLANGEAGIKASFSSSESETTKYKNSKVAIGKDGINILANKDVELGGLDIYSVGDINISGENVKTTKKLDKSYKKDHTVNIYLKQSGSVNSSVLDLVNSFSEIVEDATNNQLNVGLTAGKIIGNATNLLFNDTIGVGSKQTIGINVKHSEKSQVEETKNFLQSNENIFIKANDGDINLKNTDISANGKLILEASKNINIKGGEKINNSVAYDFNIDHSITESAGHSAVFGGNSQLGFAGNASLEKKSENNKENIVSKIKSGSLNIKSGENVEIENSFIESSGNANIEVGKNLKIKSELDEIKNERIKGGLGYNASLGVATNTIAAGNIGGNIEGGRIFEDGTSLGIQTGIEAGGTLNVIVKENLELEGSILSSSVKKGNLKVGNEIVIKDLKSDLKAGGAIVGGSGGVTGELGLDLEIGDQKDKRENINSIIGLEKGNISANKVVQNGEEIEIEDINNNILESREIKKNTFKKGGNASLSFSVKDTKELIEKVKNSRGNNKSNYVPKELSNVEKQQLFDEAKKKYRERDEAKEAEKKLKLIAENSKNIPKEHLLNAVDKLAYGLSPEDNQALREKSKDTGTKVVRPDTIEGFEGENLKNMAKILRNIEFDESYVKLREKINETIADKLDKNPEFHKLMKTKLSGNEEGIKKLFDMVEGVKRETLKEIAGIDGKKAEIEINTERGPLSLAQGYYDKNVVHTNIVPLLSFLRTQKANNKEILNTLVHELTHHDQAEIVRNKDKDISPDAKNDAKLLGLNQVFYIGSGATNYLDYKKQPLEREAFLSGDKLGEKLTKLVDKGYTGERREIKEIEHLGGENKNLESDKERKTTLENNTLIYGLKDGRKELIEAANKADKDVKNAILADSYIGYLNLGYEFSRLSDFAKKVKNNEVSSSDIDKISNYVDQAVNSNLSDSRSRINAANNEDNKRIITELLNNQVAREALIKMDELNEREKVLLDEIKKNPEADIDYPKTSSNFTDEQNKVIEEYHKVKSGLNETRLDFFGEKTKLIAKEILEKGGKVYFALDGLVTDTIKYDSEKTEINFERLKDFFDPNNLYYNSVTSRELRYIYENFRNHPNIKFTIKKQVIENPLKNLEILPENKNKIDF